MPSAQPDFDGVSIGSGAQDLIGYDIDLSAEDGSARVILEMLPKHLNRNGTLHGGIIAMLLDAAAGFAASRAASPTGFVHVVTVTLNTQYHAPARGGQVVATGTAKGGGLYILYAEAALHDDKGGLLASATGVYTRTRTKKVTS